MSALPLAARIYVATVIGFGGVLLGVFFPTKSLEAPGLFLTLLGLSSLTSVFKVNLPLARSGSTMSVSYAVDFASLLLLGPHETMLVAAASAYSQCTFRIKEPNPVHRTLFSMACLVLTVQAAGYIYIFLGGTPGFFQGGKIAQPLVGAATTYFVVNTLTIAAAIALSTRQGIVKVWNENFLWSAPSYFVGAGVAALSAWMVLSPTARTRCTWDASKTSSGTCARWRTCTSPRSRPWRSPLTPRTRRRSRTSGACSSTQPMSRRRWACPRMTFRA
jgi:hypothetical protein